MRLAHITSCLCKLGNGQRTLWQPSMRLLLSLTSCCHTTVGGYSGTSLSESSRKRWLRGSLSASRRSSRSAMLTRGLPHHVCASQRVGLSHVCQWFSAGCLHGRVAGRCPSKRMLEGPVSRRCPHMHCEAQ